MSNKILVLGATGKTGKRVAERLSKLNLPVRLGSRQANPSFNWENTNTWAEVLEGVEKVYITFQPDLAAPSASSAIRQFAEASKKAGVKKLVLLSGRGEIEAQACEAILMGSGLDWTIIRASWFMQNFSEGFFLDSVLQRELIIPRVNSLEPFIDADDIADVVVETLINNHHSHKIYELTGPQLLSFEMAVAFIAEALNEDISFKMISMEDYVSVLRSLLVPEDFIWLIQYLFSEVLDGRNESITNDIENVLGRPAGSFENYVSKTRAQGLWALKKQ